MAGDVVHVRRLEIEAVNARVGGAQEHLAEDLQRLGVRGAEDLALAPFALLGVLEAVGNLRAGGGHALADVLALVVPVEPEAVDDLHAARVGVLHELAAEGLAAGLRGADGLVLPSVQPPDDDAVALPR